MKEMSQVQEKYHVTGYLEHEDDWFFVIWFARLHAAIWRKEPINNGLRI